MKLYAAAAALLVAIVAVNIADAVEASTMKLNTHHTELAMLMED